MGFHTPCYQLRIFSTATSLSLTLFLLFSVQKRNNIFYFTIQKENCENGEDIDLKMLEKIFKNQVLVLNVEGSEKHQHSIYISHSTLCTFQHFIMLPKLPESVILRFCNEIVCQSPRTRQNLLVMFLGFYVYPLSRRVQADVVCMNFVHRSVNRSCSVLLLAGQDHNFIKYLLEYKTTLFSLTRFQ